MLQQEITPFADAHIQNLNLVLDELDALLSANIAPSPDLMENWAKKVDLAREALVRFRVCAEDEWKQKDRLRAKVRDCRLKHRDL